MKTLLLLFLLFTLSSQAQFTVMAKCIKLQDVPLDSILNPQAGAIAFSGNTLYYFNGTQWRSADNLECEQKIKLGYGCFTGDPEPEDFTDIWGEPDYFFQFTLVNTLNGYKVFQGSYIPESGYHFVKLKQ
jgi:hypothetical protein